MTRSWQSTAHAPACLYWLIPLLLTTWASACAGAASPLAPSPSALVAHGDHARAAQPGGAGSDIGVAPAPASVCERNPDGTLRFPVAAGSYRGLLRHVRCAQQKFLTMARVASALGVECDFCHARSSSDPKKLDYRVATDRKRVAAWMRTTFIDGLRDGAGQRLRCESCHRDRQGAPAAQFLGKPRDRSYTQEWMHASLTARYRQRNGKRLRCKTCHGGLAPGEPGWRDEITLRLLVADGGISIESRP